jgi:glycosyltransferase involved in cell wall biosynthesis
MRILKLHEHRTNPGGIVSLQNDFQNFYSESKHEYLHFRTGKITNHPLLSNNIIRLFDLAISYFIFPLFLIIKRPDVIEINSSLVKKSFYRDRVYLRLAKLFLPKSKLILFNHGWNDEFKKKLNSRNNLTLAIFYNSFDRVILLAKYFKNELEFLGVDSSKVDIITTGINYREYQNLKVKSKFSNRILFLSRIEPEKGIFQFLEAIPSLLAINKDFKFDIAGNGNAMEEVIQHVITKKYKENILFHGYVTGDKKIELFRNAGIYVFPSYHGEGCPISVLEAMASGLPIVYTDVGALKELLTNEENGILIPSKDSDALIKAVKQIYEDSNLRIKMGEINKKTAEKNFDLRIIFKNLEKIYEN